MPEEVVDSVAVEEDLPAGAESGGGELTALPVAGQALSTLRGEVRTAAIAAAGGLVVGAATVAAVRATRAPGSRRPARRVFGSREKQNVVASRSFLVDVHLLGR